MPAVEFVAVWLLIEVGKRVGGRALDDVAGLLYTNLTDVGRPFLGRLNESIQGNDPAATAAAAADFRDHLQQHPGEGERVVAAALKSVDTEPLLVLEAIVRVMCETVAEMQTDPPGAKPAGVAAFAGSFNNAKFVTVVDVRDRKGAPLPPPEQSLEPEPHLWFNYDGLYYHTRPRIWILMPAHPDDRDHLVRDLNKLLLDKWDRPPDVTLHLTLAELEDEDAAKGKLRRAKVRRVRAVYGDRVEPDYPDPKKDAALEAARNTAERVLIATST